MTGRDRGRPGLERLCGGLLAGLPDLSPQRYGGRTRHEGDVNRVEAGAGEGVDRVVGLRDGGSVGVELLERAAVERR